MLTIQNTFTSASTGKNTLDGGAAKNNFWTHAATVTGTGAVSATVLIEGSSSLTGAGGWYTLATLSPSGTTEASDAISGCALPAFMRARCTAISGTSASVVVTSIGG